MIMYVGYLGIVLGVAVVCEMVKMRFRKMILGSDMTVYSCCCFEATE